MVSVSTLATVAVDDAMFDIRMRDIRNGSAHRVETCRLSLTQ